MAAECAMNISTRMYEDKRVCYLKENIHTNDQSWNLLLKVYPGVKGTKLNVFKNKVLRVLCVGYAHQ